MFCCNWVIGMSSAMFFLSIHFGECILFIYSLVDTVIAS